ncbi:MAG: RDD family protein [Dehalococcoidia bacterium]
MSTNPESAQISEKKLSCAGFTKRLLAFFIDTILLSFISWGGANVLYFIGMWAWRGQTLGRMVFNVKIIKTNGEPIDLRAVIIRYLGYILCGLTLGLGFLLIIFDKRKQGLHDKLAETYVINV